MPHAQHGFAARDVSARGGYGFPGRYRTMHFDEQFAALVAHVGIFNHEDGVGSARHHSSGGNDGCSTLDDGSFRLHTRGQDFRIEPQQARQLVGGPSGIGGTHGKSINARPVEARDIDIGENVLGQDASQSLRQGDGFLTERG